jgi:hypothetical protein
MTFLKKFGSVVIKIFGIVAGITPVIQQSIPQSTPIIDKLNQIGNTILMVEGMFAAAYGPEAKTGADKLRAAVPYVAQIIQASELLSGKKIKNEALFSEACTKITSGMADVLNSLES